MASAKQMLGASLDRAIAKFGPGSPSVKALKQQLASMETYRMPSDLDVMKSGQTDNYHGSVLKSNAPSPDPMQPAMDGIEAFWSKKHAQATAKPEKAQSVQSVSTTAGKRIGISTTPK